MINRKRKALSLSTKMSIVFLALIVVCTVSLAIISYFNYKDALITAQGERSVSIATSVATLIDGDHFQSVMLTGVKDERYYLEKQFMDDYIKQVDIAYLYAMEKPSSHAVEYFRYYAEGEASEEEEYFDLFTLESIEAYMDENNSIYRALDYGETAVTQVYDTEKYGRLISAFVPIKNADGIIVGVVGADCFVEDVLAKANRYILISVVSVGLANLVAVCICQFVMRMFIRKPLGLIADASRRIVAGDLVSTLDVHSNDEFKSLAENFTQVSSTLQGLITDVTAMSAAQRRGDTDARISSDQFEGAYRTLAEGVNVTVNTYVTDMNEIMRVITAFERGNFEASLRPLPGKKEAISKSVETLRMNLIRVSNEISVLVKEATSGDLSRIIDVSQFEGNWRDITQGLNDLTDAALIPIQECAGALGELSRGSLSAKMQGDYEGDFDAIKTALNGMAGEISSYIHEINDSLTDIANGVLTKSISRRYVGEFSTIKDSINHILDRFNIVLGNIGEASRRVDENAARLSASGSGIASNAKSQGEAVVDLKTAIASIQKQTKLSAANAREASSLSDVARVNAGAGNQEMQKMVASMESIKNSSDNISSIISTIEDISFQTNLLALNAQVEAVRAGVHGLGFGVVADQVRALAGRSKQAVTESAALLEDSKRKVDEGRVIAHQTARRLNDIVENVNEVASLVEEITTASDVQLSSVEGINANLSRISRVTRENQAASEESANLSVQLAAQATELKDTVQRFVLRRHTR